MDVNFGGLEVCEVVILPFTGQHPINAVINIGTEHQRKFFVVIFSCFLFFLMENINQPVMIDDRIFLALLSAI